MRAFWGGIVYRQTDSLVISSPPVSPLVSVPEGLRPLHPKRKSSIGLDLGDRWFTRTALVFFIAGLLSLRHERVDPWELNASRGDRPSHPIKTKLGERRAPGKGRLMYIWRADQFDKDFR
jgi:hypothetical protein